MLPGQVCLHNLSLELSLRLDAGIINTLGRDIRRWVFETNVSAAKSVQRILIANAITTQSILGYIYYCTINRHAKLRKERGGRPQLM